MENDGLFAPAPARRSLPWRDRRTLPRGCTRFGPDNRFELFVAPEAVASLRAGTAKPAPDEAFGLLVGRALSDARGTYAVVTGAVYAKRSHSGPSHVKLTAGESAELRRLAEETYPAEDIIGWTHSHSRSSAFSSTDRDEQSTWPDDHHVGILTFMEGEVWGRAYHGPGARPLAADGLMQPPPTRLAPQVLGSPLGTLSSEQEQGDGCQAVSEAQGGDHRHGKLVLPVASLVLLAALASVAAVLAIDHRLVAMESHMPPPAPTTLAWSCDRGLGQAPLRVECGGPVGSGITGWVWDFGDGSGASSPTAAHIFQRPGRYSIGLTLLTPTGSVHAGRQEVVAVHHAGVDRWTCGSPECADGTDVMAPSSNDNDGVIDMIGHPECADGTDVMAPPSYPGGGLAPSDLSDSERRGAP